MDNYKVDIDYCMSSFLMYRRVVDQTKSFLEGKRPKTVPLKWDKVPIKDSFELEDYLRERVAEATKDGNVALALSGGIDSAILAKFMPKGSTAYTFRCIADGVKTTDETKIASQYASICGLKHKIIDIYWKDMVEFAPLLMEKKSAPLHSIEVQIYKAGMAAIKDGFTGMIYGETADVNYGGLSKILSHDWNTEDFIERYAYLKPWSVLRHPKMQFIDMTPYVKDDIVDVHKYLSEFDIIESVNSYVNACETAGIKFIAPYAGTYLSQPLDYERVRKGENKYLIREVFSRLYPNLTIPTKIPMPRPTDEWLKNWNGPKRDEFIEGCQKHLTGDQKWLLWCLERILNKIDEKSGGVDYAK